MSCREVSIAFQTNKSASEYIALAKLINEYHFDVVSVYCDLPYQPSYGPLLLMAPYIKKSRLGPAAVSPSRIHPLDIAANSALLSQIAEGGIYVGLARGAWLENYGINEVDKPIQGIKEACFIIRKILSGDLPGFHGEVFYISRTMKVPYPVPGEEIPILIGTWGPKLSRVAGEIADEVKVGGSSNPNFGMMIKGWINEGKENSHRSKDTVKLVMGAVTVVDEDGERAKQKAKEELVVYFPVVAQLDKTLNIPPDLIQRIKIHLERDETKAAAQLISDDLMEKFAFAGTPNDVIRQSEALYEAGVDRIEFGTPHGISSKVGIDLIGRKVLPNLPTR